MTEQNNISIQSDDIEIRPTDFVTIWDTMKTGKKRSSPGLQLPLDEDGEYNFVVHWGDGSSDTITSHDQAETLHNYAEEGTYRVVISGDIEGFGFSRAKEDEDEDVIIADRKKLIDVIQWGNMKFHNNGDQLSDCVNLEGFSATDAPDLSGITDLSGMFQGASRFNGDISRWDVSGVADLSYMFNKAGAFNQPLNTWNVGIVTNMKALFQYAKTFNQPLDDWNVSNVTDMSFMFFETESFNHPLDAWDVSNATTMECMFQDAKSFDQPLEKWNVKNVKSTSSMFWGAKSFNQPLNGWNVGNVTDMSGMFCYVSSFNQPLNTWDVSNVTNMNSLFSFAESFQQPLDSWNVGRVKDMNYMFEKASAFNQPLNGWNVGRVKSMDYMFSGTESFNQPLGNWNVKRVRSMVEMFKDAASFSQDLSSWCVPLIESRPKDFSKGAGRFTPPLWGASSSCKAEEMDGNAWDKKKTEYQKEPWYIAKIVKTGKIKKLSASSPAERKSMALYALSGFQNLDRYYLIEKLFYLDPDAFSPFRESVLLWDEELLNQPFPIEFQYLWQISRGAGDEAVDQLADRLKADLTTEKQKLDSFDKRRLALLMGCLTPRALERLAELARSFGAVAEYCESYLFEIPEKGAATPRFTPDFKEIVG